MKPHVLTFSTSGQPHVTTCCTCAVTSPKKCHVSGCRCEAGDVCCLRCLLYKLRQLRVKLISRVVKESSDSLFPSKRRLISLQYSEMLSISLRFHCLSPDMVCTAFSHAKPPRNIHAAHLVTLSRF